MRRHSKKNPWRNTRNDFQMPWKKIYGAMMIISMPIMLLTLAPNIILRSGAFYSYFLSKTGVVKDIPYAITMENVRDTFSSYMWHGMKVFNLREQEGYMPQWVFTNEDNIIMNNIRTWVDILAVICILSAVLLVIAIFKLYNAKKKEFLLSQFKGSLILSGICMILGNCLVLIQPVRAAIFQGRFGTEFPPGDVLIQIFQAGFPIYFGIGCIVVTIIAAGGITYLMNKFVASRNLF